MLAAWLFRLGLFRALPLLCRHILDSRSVAASALPPSPDDSNRQNCRFFTYSSLWRCPDCRFSVELVSSFQTVEMNKRVPLSEKLIALREADGFRKWYSLDDRRVCVLCDRVINGRMIDIWQETNGSYRLHCPTPGRRSTPGTGFITVLPDRA